MRKDLLIEEEGTGSDQQSRMGAAQGAVRNLSYYAAPDGSPQAENVEGKEEAEGRLVLIASIASSHHRKMWCAGVMAAPAPAP